MRRWPAGSWRRLPRSVRVGAALFGAGVAAGVAGSLLTLLLHAVQHLALGYDEGTFLAGLTKAPPLRRFLAPTIGGFVVGSLWWWLRTVGRGGAVDPHAPSARGGPGLGRTLADAALQVSIVGSGASVGREGAPRQAAAALALWISRRLYLPSSDRRAVVAAAAGAGLAAVYNVPVSGVAFTFEVLLRRRRSRAVAYAVPMSALATVVAWPVVGVAPVYQFPDLSVGNATWAWALIAPLPCAAVGAWFTWVAGRGRSMAPPPGWRLPVAMTLVGAAVGIASWWLPELPGNGKGVLEVGLAGGAPWVVFALLVVLKPLATAATLGSGATGGLLTPSLATGAALGGVISAAVGELGVGTPLASFVLIGAVGVLAVTQKAPLLAVALGWELTRPGLLMLAPLLVVAIGSHLVNSLFHRERPRRPR